MTEKYINEHGEECEDNVDRCCCECGDHFVGSTDDDYCYKCWNKLGFGEVGRIWP